MNNKKIIFLHIPKTAGQSVHHFLLSLFDENLVLPARVNSEIIKYSIKNLNKYYLFSGHFDWSLMDCVSDPKYTFTVLRKPIDRILSFYFYLRKKGSLLTEHERNMPNNYGLKAAFERDPNEYFQGGPLDFNNFIKNHYDNFYTYFFAARRYSGRTDFEPLISSDVFGMDDVLKIAIANLSTLDGIFIIDNLDEIFKFLKPNKSVDASSSFKFKINVNDEILPDERLTAIRNLGATDSTIKLLHSFCEFDDMIWQKISTGELKN